MYLFQVGFLDIGWLDLLDVLLVAVLLYQVYNLLRGGVASRVFIGYLLVYFTYLIVKALGLNLLSTILGYFISVGALALIVLFQQEIRRFLLLIGKSTNLAGNRYVRQWLLRQPVETQPSVPLAPILEACKTLSADFSGGLIAIQRNDDLDRFVLSGEPIEGVLSRSLLLAVFCSHSPLHDGAVIVANNQIRAARCILPVSDDDTLPASLGFRHRAALGLSEVTDAAIIAVSEETGRLTLALNGKLTVGLSNNELAGELQAYFMPPRRR